MIVGKPVLVDGFANGERRPEEKSPGECRAETMVNTRYHTLFLNNEIHKYI